MNSRYADSVIKNANVITVDDDFPKAEGFAVRNGRFIAVGKNEVMDDLIGPTTKVVDLSGTTILPGFIDAHIHVLSSGIRHEMAADCSLGSIREIQDALRERADRTTPGDWVQGFKFDDTKTSDNRFLNRNDLDAVSTQHPIYVSHRAGHVYYVNSLALDLVGYHNESSDPPGGRIGRNEVSGELDGVIYERAGDPFRSMVPVGAANTRREGLRTICKMLNQAGLTSVHDAAVTNEQFVTYQEGKDAGDLSLRVYMLMTRAHLPALLGSGIRTGFGDELLRVGGIKCVADGAIAARTAYLSEPYIGSDHDHGILAMSPEELEPVVIEAHNAGFQVCVHANGDSAIDMVLTAYEKAQVNNPRVDTRHRIEHCTLVNPGLLDRMHALKCIATPFCTYVYYHGEKMKFFGEERLEWMFPQRSFIDYDIISTGATDYPPGPFEPLLGIQSCVTRIDSSGNIWGPNQKISVEEAIKIYTLNGAYASFEENLKGSITPGKLADYVVLGEDLTAIDPLTIKDVDVLQTVLGGTAVYEA